MRAKLTRLEQAKRRKTVACLPPIWNPLNSPPDFLFSLGHWGKEAKAKCYGLNVIRSFYLHYIITIMHLSFQASFPSVSLAALPPSQEAAPRETDPETPKPPTFRSPPSSRPSPAMSPPSGGGKAAGMESRSSFATLSPPTPSFFLYSSLLFVSRVKRDPFLGRRKKGK